MTKKKIMVIGDIFVDRYVWVDSHRMCEEDPTVPIYDVVKVEDRPGGAANVAANLGSIVSDGADVHLFGIIGRELEDVFGGGSAKLESPRCSETLYKTRYVDKQGQMFSRVDSTKVFSFSSRCFFEDTFDLDRLVDYDAFVISDYDKGTVSEALASVIIGTGKLVVVDSKRKDLRCFEGATVLKVNQLEASVQESRFRVYGRAFEAMFKMCVVTQGAAGAQIRYARDLAHDKYEIVKQDISAPTAQVVDVTGCGDTHTAAMVWALLENREPHEAVTFANACAAKVVSMFGTSIF